MSWTTVPDKQKDITPEEVKNGPYPEPDENVLVTVEINSAIKAEDGERKVLQSSLLPQVWNDNYEWLQSDGSATVIAWKELPDPYED